MASDIRSTQSLRARVYRQLDPSAWSAKGLSPVNGALALLIIVATISAVLETEPTLSGPYRYWFDLVEAVVVPVFAVEYLMRLWIAPERGGGAVRDRFAFVFSLSGLIDLVVILGSVLPFAGNIAMLRIVRLLRIARLAKLGRFSVAMRELDNAIWSRRHELTLTLALAIAVLLFGATALYWLEGELQPDKFGSIPRSIWWAVITMTTIGYGDVYPLTVAGKVVASLVAFCGIGLIAMPTGILAAAFSDAMQQRSRDPD